ncbi:hypothetical protein [Caulobacter sp. 1776]|uniref:hypothetical protein n=1 Tax=Caulobacter sp. 1776 TaxID=3156420 RepID=UPI0033919793
MTTLDAVGGSFDFGRVVQRTFKVVGQNLGLFALSALVLVSTPIFVGTVVSLKSRLAGDFFSVGLVAGTIVATFGSLILQALVVHTVIARMNGRAVGFGDSLSVALRFALPLLGLGIIQGLGVMIGLLLLVVPGVILSVMWSVTTPSLIVEKRGIFESLQRSRDLTRGHRWSIVGLFLVYMVLSMIVGAVIGGVSAAAGFSTLRGATPSGALDVVTPMVLISTFLSALVNGAQGVLVAAGVASIYYELRTTKEGVPPEQMAAVFD